MILNSTVDQTARSMAASAGAGAIYAAAHLRFPLNTVVGTDNVVSAALPFGFIALENMMGFVFESVGMNTGAMTLDIGDGVARAITHIGGAVMVAGDIPAADTVVEVFYDSSVNNFHAQLIRQPASLASPQTTSAGVVGASTRYARQDHAHQDNSVVSWTPNDASGAGLVFLSPEGSYRDTGNKIEFVGRLTYPVTADASIAILGGLPVPCNASGNASISVTYTAVTQLKTLAIIGSTSTFQPLDIPAAGITNATLSGAHIRFGGFYFK